MKIVAGLGCVEEYERFVKAGADEFFCGYVPYSWSEKYGTVMPLNRREVLCYNVQIGAFSELEILAAMIRKYQKPVHITVNALYYIPEQYAKLERLIRSCMQLGFSSYIIADPALLVYLREKNLDCEIHLSGEAGELNHEGIEALKKWKLRRIIFPRKTTIREMEQMISASRRREDLRMPEEFEAFALNELCQFSGGFCNSVHCDEMGYLCRVPYQVGAVRRSGAMKNAAAGNGFSEHKEMEDAGTSREEDGYLCGETGCGLCALYKLRAAGITHLKLVGRGNYADYMEKDICNLKKALEILEKAQSEEDFVRKMKEKLFPGGCSGNCYYL